MPVWAADASVEAEALFENSVRPLLAERCFKCHGAKKQENGLRLDHRAGLLRGGISGAAIVPGDPDESLLVRAVRREGELAMPPEDELTPREVKALVQWIELGAPWPGDEKPPAGPAIRSGPITLEERRHWAYQPVVRPALPRVQNSSWCRNGIDRLVLADIEEASLTPVEDATKRARIRRATFDLTGLPPTVEEIDDFLSDRSSQAWSRLLDRLLGSPHYGERWGRHWLDVVRYADTAGETADYPVTQAWRYRNWVIDAFNQDKPYDVFLREQLTGDILAQSAPPERLAGLVTATGFLAISRRFGFGIDDQHYLTIQDTIDTLGQAVLGLTLGCARCHDHKYDPVTMQDYYGWYGILASTKYALSGDEKSRKERDLVPLIPFAEAKGMDAPRLRQLREAEEAVKALEKERKQLGEALKTRDVDPEKPPPASETPEDVTTMLARNVELRREIDEKNGRIRKLSRLPYPAAYAVREGEAQDASIQRRGDPLDPGDVVPRRQLEILGGTPVRDPETTSGRLDLARWLTDAENPLTARVLVNRLWRYHFGRGLVESPNDFGVRGRAPTHPALLDWLASEFVASGWSMKHMHRLIMTSRTYQLSSRPGGAPTAPPLSAARELERTQLFGRYPRRRLEAEAIRDAMLAVSEQLDRTRGVGHPFPSPDTWGFSQHRPFYAVYPSKRRSVYLMTQRLKPHPFLTLFDAADPSTTTARRTETTTPTQALYLMNSPFVHDLASQFAERVLEQSTSYNERLRSAFESALGRPPTADEIGTSRSFLDRYRSGLENEGGDVPESERERAAWSALARTILVRNEFLFVE